MSDVNRGDRPLSPHLSVYRPQMSMITSITHRITGVGMTLALVWIVWWFLALSTGPESFGAIDGSLTSWFGILVLVGSLWALSYHFCNGIRHLFWDMGYCLEKETAQKTGIAVFVASVVLTIIILLIA